MLGSISDVFHGCGCRQLDGISHPQSGHSLSADSTVLLCEFSKGKRGFRVTDDREPNSVCSTVFIPYMAGV